MAVKQKVQSDFSCKQSDMQLSSPNIIVIDNCHNFTGFSFLYLTLSQTINLDASKLKEFADDNFRFDENCRKFFQRVENNVRKGETARY